MPGEADEFVVPLRLVIDEATAREWYAEYVGDWQYYKEHDPSQLTPESMDYGPVAPTPWERWLKGLRDGILGDVLESGVCYRVERAP